VKSLMGIKLPKWMSAKSEGARGWHLLVIRDGLPHTACRNSPTSIYTMTTRDFGLVTCKGCFTAAHEYPIHSGVAAASISPSVDHARFVLHYGG